ncbi:MAG: ATP-binding cassette domain-containing protein [Clostridia bacterium]|nr:ATP-binding cassette domain-containing protein [Clostridia bacterium]
MKVLELCNVSFNYGNDKNKFVLNGINLSVDAGEHIAVTGETGSGKSTLLKVICGISIITAGKIKVVESDVNCIAISVVFQNPDNCFVSAFVLEDILFGLKNIGYNRAKGIDYAIELLKEFGLYEYKDCEINSLSGGQKQKLALLNALALNPKILILDEATSMLDNESARELFDVILKHQQNRNFALINITKKYDEIINAEKVLVLQRGQIVDFNKPEALISKNRYLKNLAPFSEKLAQKLINLDCDLPAFLSIKEVVK